MKQKKKRLGLNFAGTKIKYQGPKAKCVIFVGTKQKTDFIGTRLKSKHDVFSGTKSIFKP
jgi:hypothetical protein